MKRTAGAFTLLAALGGCMGTNQSTNPNQDHFGQVGRAKEMPGLVGPWGQPVAQTANGTAAPVSGTIIPISARGSGEGLLGPDGTPSQLQQATATSTAGKAVAKSAPTWGKGNGKVQPPPFAGPA